MKISPTYQHQHFRLIGAKSPQILWGLGFWIFTLSLSTLFGISLLFHPIFGQINNQPAIIISRIAFQHNVSYHANNGIEIIDQKKTFMP